MRIKRINLAVQNNQPMPPFTYILPAAISIWAWICIHRYNKLMAEFYDASGEMSADNLQSFYRNFSEIMQMTPKQWLSK